NPDNPVRGSVSSSRNGNLVGRTVLCPPQTARTQHDCGFFTYGRFGAGAGCGCFGTGGACGAGAAGTASIGGTVGPAGGAAVDEVTGFRIRNCSIASPAQKLVRDCVNTVSQILRASSVQ